MELIIYHIQYIFRHTPCPLVGDVEERYDAATLMDVLYEAVPIDLFGDGYLEVVSELLITAKDMYYTDAVSRELFVQCVTDV